MYRILHWLTEKLQKYANQKLYTVKTTIQGNWYVKVKQLGKIIELTLLQINRSKTNYTWDITYHLFK